MVIAIYAVPKITVFRQGVNPGYADEQHAVISKSTRDLVKQAKRISDVFEYVVQNNEPKAVILRRRRKTLMSNKRHVHRRFDAVGLPAMSLQPVEHLAIAAADVQRGGARRRRMDRRVWGNGVKQDIALAAHDEAFLPG
jgi:hypothetical protein